MTWNQVAILLTIAAAVIDALTTRAAIKRGGVEAGLVGRYISEPVRELLVLVWIVLWMCIGLPTVLWLVMAGLFALVGAGNYRKARPATASRVFGEDLDD